MKEDGKQMFNDPIDAYTNQNLLDILTAIIDEKYAW